jgi:hypothetical protein
MLGEFRGDFTRNTFNPQKHFLRVLTQQGRVQLDADANEQSSIIIHYLQSLAADMMGPHAAPFEDGGFKIITVIDPALDEETKKRLNDLLNKNGFIISKGKYYVNGILCVNDDDTAFFDQPFSPFPVPERRENPIAKDGKYLVYLDVWERHINYIQDEVYSGETRQEASIRETALGGIDTASRSQIIWQVKFSFLNEGEGKVFEENKDFGAFLDILRQSSTYVGTGTGQLKAKAKVPDSISTDPCIVKPSSSYRGTENQLYRVEIHDVGVEKATFKWSRENSSVVFPIQEITTSSSGQASTTFTVALTNLGWDDRFTLKHGDWVELVDDDYIVQNIAEPLLMVETVDSSERTVTLVGNGSNVVRKNLRKHPFLRRWDHNNNTAENIKANLGGDGLQTVEVDKWILLENGIEIYFHDSAKGKVSGYRKGDYWLIPARTATGDIEWPHLDSANEPDLVYPHGVVHYHAPLAVITVKDGTRSNDCRRMLKQQWDPA